MPSPRLFVLLAPLLAGCIVEQSYYVEARDLRAVRLFDADTQRRAAVRAVRTDDGAPVLLRVSALPPGALGADIPDDARVAVPTRVTNTRLTIGAALAGAGAVFAAGAIISFLQGDRDYRRCTDAGGWFCDFGLGMSQGVGATLSLLAAGHIIAGSVLVVNGAGAHPQEHPGTPPPILPPPPPPPVPPEPAPTPPPVGGFRPPPARFANISFAF